MNKYEKYKDSGVQWLGEIPEHWEILPSKRYFYYKKEINKNYISDNVLSLTLRGVVNNDIENPEGLVPKDYATYQYFEKDNLVFKLIDLENVSTSRVGIVHENGIMSSAYIRLISGSKIFNKYAYYFYFSLYKNQVFNKLGSGVRSTLNPTDLLNLSFVKPPLSEQTAIANFLDDKTAKIDQAIALKEKEIALLKERRQILIQQAVTKGLDATVPMKDSGVDWIGEIPEHWEVRKLVSLCRFVRGNSPFGKDELLNTGEYIALQYGKTYKVNEVNEGYSFFVNNEFYKNSQVVNYGDVILVSTSETIEDLGHTVYYRRSEIGLLGGEQIMLKPNQEQVDSRFLYFSAKVFSKELRKFATGIKVFRFNINDLKTIFNAVPPISEQTKIVSYLEDIEAKIAKAISLKQQEIEKLKEYKTVLIDNVVTGKVRVS